MAQTTYNAEPEAIVGQGMAGVMISETQLVEDFRQGINNMLARITGDPARAEDLTHDTLMVVLEKLRNGDIQQPSRLASFVYSTARYVHLGWSRKRGNQMELREQMDDIETPATDIEQTLMSEQLEKELRDGIASLSMERDREVLLRHYLGEQTKDEVCEALVIEPQQFDRVISRARKRLKHQLQTSR